MEKLIEARFADIQGLVSNVKPGIEDLETIFLDIAAETGDGKILASMYKKVNARWVIPEITAPIENTLPKSKFYSPCSGERMCMSENVCFVLMDTKQWTSVSSILKY
jgi:hypothetical protein